MRYQVEVRLSPLGELVPAAGVLMPLSASPGSVN